MENTSLEQDSKEEILDVVDEQGNVIGQANRYECHNNPEYLHPVVQFTSVDLKERKILFVKRACTKKYDPGKNTFLGEHVRSGETPNLGLIRAVEEELGFRPRGFLSTGTNIFSYDKQTELATFYLVSYRGEELMPESDEIESLEWVSLDEVKNYDDNVGEITKYWMDRVNWERISY